jgi:uroporphyrinogen III methyltransferase/synthase
MKIRGRVCLVGAGCGKDLITIEGMQALKNAEVVVYDDLIDDGLLSEVSEECEKIYVGKRFHKHSKKQDEINQILIAKASEGKRVVRLKGGDAFVFGRGGEEYLAVTQAGFNCKVIPGISSAIAVPEHVGIPVTHRGVARSFTVITGHTMDGTSENFEALAHLEGTLVFLMGLHSCAHISDELIKYGKSQDTPAAIISNGFSPEEKRYDTTLKDLAATVEWANSPAVIVIGETAGLHYSDIYPEIEEKNDINLRATEKNFSSEYYNRAEKKISVQKVDENNPTENHHAHRVKSKSSQNIDEKEFLEIHAVEKPLLGVRIAVTGTESFSKKTVETLSRYGADAKAVKTIDIVPKTDIDYRDINTYNWLVFTSSNGVKIWFEGFKKNGCDLRSLAGTKIAVIGKGTAETLESIGLVPDFIPSEFTAETLGRELGHKISDETSDSETTHKISDEISENETTQKISAGKNSSCNRRVLILRAANGSKALTEELDKAGVDYEDLAIYGTEAISADKQAFTGCDYIVFGSAGGVDAFFQNKYDMKKTAKLVSIGRYTAEEILKYTGKPVITAKEFTAEGIAKAIISQKN